MVLSKADWLRPWLAGSQGIAWCGVEYLMLIEGVLFLAFLLVMLRRSEI